MKLNRLSIYAVASLIAISSCVAEDPTNKQGTESSDDIIKFGLSSSAETKTVYDTNNKYQINWVLDDKITIYSPQAQTTGGSVNRATYVVTPGSTAKDGSIEAESAALKWGAETLHDFYAVYPAVDGIIIQEDGTMFLPASHSQFVQLGAKTGSKYSTIPDMKNAYMVAHSQVDRTAGTVNLRFEPIMTTLEITVNGKEASGAQQKPVIVTGISVGYNLPSDSPTTHMKINGTDGNLVMQGTSASLTKQEAVYVGIKSANGDYVELNDDESVTITVFVPAFVIDKDRPIKIRVHAAGATEMSVTLPKAGMQSTTIAERSKVSINLPKYPNTPKIGNNWITPLNDDIYVSQLSIPGSHDAATGDGTPFSLGKTQEMSLDKQFEMGIRAFDLRPAVSGNDIIIAHGLVATTYNWTQIMERFQYYLKENPGEFIIIIMRHEDEYDSNDGTWGEKIRDRLSDLENTTNISTGESFTIDFRPDLTIGDMRGKILFISRHNYGDLTQLVGGYTGWSHSKDGAQVEIYGPIGPRGTLNIQDCFNASEAGVSLINSNWKQDYLDAKWEGINGLLEQSRYFHTDNSMINRWSINHTSGYTGRNVALAVVSTTDGYRENAANNHIKFYNKITGAGWEGSTGIILSDFVGARTSGSYTVYGDLLPQAIIDNNYKYRMQRRPTPTSN